MAVVSKALVPAFTFLLSACIGLDTVQVRIGTYWEMAEGIFPTLLLWVGVIAFYACMRRVFKDTHRALAFTLFSIYLVFHYDALMEEMDALNALLVLAAVIAAGAILINRFTNVAIIFVQTLGWLLFLNSLFLLSKILLGGWVERYDLASLPIKANLLNAAKPTSANNSYPDIYFIVLDGYASNETLQREFGFDNLDFLNFLKKNGFYIAEKSRSYYSQTMLSVASTLNLNYFQEDVRVPHADYADRTPAANYFLRPRLTEYLKEMGYELHKLTSAYNLDYTFDSKKTDVRGEAFNVRVSSALINRTPLYQILNFLFEDDREFLNPYKEHYHTITGQHEALRREFAEQGTESPKFIYAHFLQPHPPFIFDAGGNFADYPKMMPFGYTDGMRNNYAHLYPGGWIQFYRSAYIEQLRYLNRQIKESIRTAVANKTGRPKVIIIQGDHGSRRKMDFGSIENSELNETFGILNAVYFPDGGYSTLSHDISPLNVMRMVMNKYFAFNLPKLVNHQWYSTWNKPYAFIEATGNL